MLIQFINLLSKLAKSEECIIKIIKEDVVTKLLNIVSVYNAEDKNDDLLQKVCSVFTQILRKDENLK